MINIIKRVISKVKLLMVSDNTLKIDLSYVQRIVPFSSNELKEISFVEKMLLNLGMNDETISEIPKELHKYCGFGLRYWQYPNQLSKYLVFLSDYKIQSYLEIGVRHGGTYIITLEYLKKFNEIAEAIGIDIIANKSLEEYSRSNKCSKFYRVDSTTKEFNELLENKKFDLVFIDGNHEEEFCRKDFKLIKDLSNIIVLHDIVSDACPGVKKVWEEIKTVCKEQYLFYEFTDQYESLDNIHNSKYFGIGVAVRKNWI